MIKARRSRRLSQFAVRVWTAALLLGAIGLSNSVAAGPLDDLADTIRDTIRISAQVDALRERIAAQAGRPSYLVLGDSLTESAALRPVCGREPINGGIGGATTDTFVHRAASLARRAESDVVVIALGINDTFAVTEDEFRQTYGDLLTGLQREHRVLVMPIAPVEPGKPMTAAPEKPEQVARFNAVIAELAESRKIPVVPLPETLPTVDGVHLTPEGYERWRDNLENGLREALDCPSAP